MNDKTIIALIDTDHKGVCQQGGEEDTRGRVGPGGGAALPDGGLQAASDGAQLPPTGFPGSLSTKTVQLRTTCVHRSMRPVCAGPRGLCVPFRAAHPPGIHPGIPRKGRKSASNRKFPNFPQKGLAFSPEMVYHTPVASKGDADVAQ